MTPRTVSRRPEFSALVYDHRGFGSSDGLPRHETNPTQQAEDYHDAVTAAMKLPGVDPVRAAIWGIGHSGGAAMIAAADDPRLAAVILNMPFISGRIDAAKFPQGVLERAWRNRESTVVAAEPVTAYVQLWPTSLANARGEEGEKVFLAGEVPYNFIVGALERSNAAGTRWENKLSLQSLYHLARAEPRDFAPRITAPLLYIAAEEDPITAPLEAQRAVFNTVPGNGEFAIVKPHHLGTYFGDAFEAAVAVQIDFLRRKL